MAAIGRGAACSTFLLRCQVLLFLSFLLAALVQAGKHHHNQGHSLNKLLAAGLIAKALAKGGEEEGGGEGHHYVPIPIPVHHHGGGHHHHHGSESRHHHHIHHKYVPIPVKHHTNFIIAHHKVPVPVHVPVPVVKTKLVHVPVEKTKIVPIIVHKGKHTHPHSISGSSGGAYGAGDYGPYGSSTSTVHVKKGRVQLGSSSKTSGIAALATAPRDTKQVRITSLGTVRKVKDGSRNNSTATSIKFHRTSSRSPNKWIVVVKNGRRPPTRRYASDNVTADSNVVSTITAPNSTYVIPGGPR